MLIGDTDLSKRLVVAPMADVSDSSFRYIAKKYGAGLTFTQMVSAKGILENDFSTLRYLAFSKNEKPIGVQLLGSDPELVSAAVKEIKRYKPDTIDLNCGCPKDSVTKFKMGACLMNTPANVGKLIAGMKKSAGDIPISAKFRLGENDKKITLIENAKAAEDNGASFIIVHARTKDDKYDQSAKWGWLAKVKSSVNIPVIGNGSVFYPDDAVRMKEETGVDSVMVARGALGNPFLFSRYNSIVDNNYDPGVPGVKLVKDILLEHIDKLQIEYGSVRSLNYIKKNTIWYFRDFTGISNFIEKIMAARSIEQIKELIEVHSEKIKNGDYPIEDLDIIKQKFKMKVLFWLVKKPVFTENFG
ncbi:MAG: tRNA-dihydrouridine synthase family protein [Melioribacteraceae bacterium]|nr:tRNA-dihydrouridine synthase family protein [Melioribacteraceae bacterium]